MDIEIYSPDNVFMTALPHFILKKRNILQSSFYRSLLTKQLFVARHGENPQSWYIAACRML